MTSSDPMVRPMPAGDRSGCAGGQLDGGAGEHVGGQDKERDGDDSQHPLLGPLIGAAAAQFGAQAA
jgi:hypothetical protein